MKAGYFFTLFPSPMRNGNIFYLKSTSFVVIDKEYGVILFDTGTPSNSKEILSNLKQNFDINPEDVKWVFNTHIHPDHVGGNQLFKKAKLVFSKNEFEFTQDIAEVAFSDKNLQYYLHEKCPGYRTSFDDFETENMRYYLKQYWNIENIGMRSNPSFIEENPEIPPFIKILPSPGHTFFHYSFKIECLPYNIYITGDAISTRFSLHGNNELRLNEPHMDFDKYFKTINIFKEYDGIFIPGHDRPFRSKTKERIKENIFELNKIS